MKKIETVTIKIDTNMDADDYGHRIAECVSKCNPELNFINLVKVNFGTSAPSMENLGRMMQHLKDMFLTSGAENCVFVPIGECIGVKDIQIEKIQVSNDDTNS